MTDHERTRVLLDLQNLDLNLEGLPVLYGYDRSRKERTSNDRQTVPSKWHTCGT